MAGIQSTFIFLFPVCGFLSHGAKDKCFRIPNEAPVIASASHLSGRRVWKQSLTLFLNDILDAGVTTSPTSYWPKFCHMSTPDCKRSWKMYSSFQTARCQLKFGRQFSMEGECFMTTRVAVTVSKPNSLYLSIARFFSGH